MPDHKDLPSGSQAWARKLDDALKLVDHLQNVVQRVTKDLGVDYANPKRGLSQGSVPSVQNPISLKLASLYDLEVRNLTPDDVLTWDADKQRWVARPVLFDFVGSEDGDVLTWDHTEKKWVPAPPKASGGISIVPADTWSIPLVLPNYLNDPSIELGISEWSGSGTGFAGMSHDGAFSFTGDSSLRIDALKTSPIEGPDGGNIETGYVLPLETRFFGLWVKAPNTLHDINITLFLQYESGGKTESTNGQPVHIGQGGTDWTYVYVRANSPQSPETLINAVINFGGFYETSDEFYIDSAVVSSDATNGMSVVPTFDGNTVSHPAFIPSWDGGQNASTSKATLIREIAAPAEIPRGSLAQVLGKDFDPFEQVILTQSGYNKVVVNADENGAFDTLIYISVDTPLGFGWIGVDSSSSEYPPEVDVTIVEATQ